MKNFFNKKDLKRIDYNQLKQVFKILENRDWKPEYEKDKIVGLKREKSKNYY